MDVTPLTTAQIDAMKQYGVRVVSGVEDAQPRRSTTMSTISSSVTAPMPA